jgi:nitroimidazol reductase NimA-like FMN-containing flavoprotein (pyridoxamine 5'-phosphate oxidase superfamily)
MRKKEREIKNMVEIESIIQDADVCRIALTDGNTPYIVPMNFGYTGGNERRIFFHCAPEGRKLEMIRKNNYTCFEMDVAHKVIKGRKACDFTMKYRSVIGYGYISEIDGLQEKMKGLDCIMSHYSNDKIFTYNQETLEKTTVLCLEISQITGKKC